MRLKLRSPRTHLAESGLPPSISSSFRSSDSSPSAFSSRSSPPPSSHAASKSLGASSCSSFSTRPLCSIRIRLIKCNMPDFRAHKHRRCTFKSSTLWRGRQDSVMWRPCFGLQSARGPSICFVLRNDPAAASSVRTPRRLASQQLLQRLLRHALPSKASARSTFASSSSAFPSSCPTPFSRLPFVVRHVQFAWSVGKYHQV